MANVSDDRRRAARLLIRVEQGAFASRLVEGDPTPGVRSRVFGVLRWQRRIDHRLEPFLKRPLARLDPEVRAALRIGCFEGAELGVPGPVATDATLRRVVAAAGELRLRSLAGTVRRIGSQMARGEIVVWTDADMTYPNERIPELVGYLDDNPGYDQVVGARTSEKGTHKFARVPAKWTIRKLAEVLTGAKPGRTDPQQVTVFKSVGMAVQDAVTAVHILNRAELLHVGSNIELF